MANAASILRNLIMVGLSINNSENVILSGMLPEVLKVNTCNRYVHLLTPAGIKKDVDFSRSIEWDGLHLNNCITADTIAVIIETSAYGGRNQKFTIYQCEDFRTRVEKETARWEQWLNA
jgi:hypothetical protein